MLEERQWKQRCETANSVNYPSIQTNTNSEI